MGTLTACRKINCVSLTKMQWKSCRPPKDDCSGDGKFADKKTNISEMAYIVKLTKTTVMSEIAR